MIRSKKLQPVVKHVESHEQTALKGVAFSQRQLQQQLDKLQQLKEYKDEYANKHASGQQSIYSPLQLQEFNRFFSQLTDTIEQQQKIVGMAEREVEMKRQKWKLTRSRSDAIHKVVSKIEARELKQVDKIEQTFMDEVALRISLKR